jgi:nucleoside-diphosphate-sugar epimerase
MNILITGGSGFIGTNLVSYFLSSGNNVLNLDISQPKIASHFPSWLKVDIRNHQSVLKAFSKFSPHFVIHLAARTDLSGVTIEDYDSNTVGVEVIADAVIANQGIKYSVFASSMLVCKIGYTPKHEDDYNPSTLYGQSKVLGEKIIRSKLSNIKNWTIVRPTSIYGPYFSAPYIDLFRSVRDGWFIVPCGYSIKRNYGFVLNLVRQIDAILNDMTGSLEKRAIYIADYEPVDLLSFATMIADAFGSSRKIKRLPLWLFYLASKIGDFLKLSGYKSPPLTTFRLNNILTNQIVDLSPLENICKNLPYDRKSGVQLTAQWLCENDGGFKCEVRQVGDDTHRH